MEIQIRRTARPHFIWELRHNYDCSILISSFRDRCRNLCVNLRAIFNLLSDLRWSNKSSIFVAFSDQGRHFCLWKMCDRILAIYKQWKTCRRFASPHHRMDSVRVDFLRAIKGSSKIISGKQSDNHATRATVQFARFSTWLSSHLLTAEWESYT